MSSLILPDGLSGEHESPRRGARVKQVVFNWTTVCTLIGAAAGYGVLQQRTDANAEEIRRLRTLNEARAESDVRVAREMVTKDDLNRVRAELLEAIRARR